MVPLPVMNIRYTYHMVSRRVLGIGRGNGIRRLDTQLDGGTEGVDGIATLRVSANVYDSDGGLEMRIYIQYDEITIA
jgi:hypothetical protein